jgi:hypothetical protein
MLRRAISVVLVFSWVILAGIDVLEDLDLPDRIEFQCSSKTTLPAGSGAPLARNIVESATHSGIRCSGWLEQLTPPVTIHTPHLSQKVSKLHKVNRVFLI